MDGETRTNDSFSISIKVNEMKYKCEICDSVFDYPLVQEYYEPQPDGYWEHFKNVLCPICNTPYFKEFDEEQEK